MAAEGPQAGGPAAEGPSRLMDPYVSRAKTFGTSFGYLVSGGQGEAAVRWGPCQRAPSPHSSADRPEGTPRLAGSGNPFFPPTGLLSVRTLSEDPAASEANWLPSETMLAGQLDSDTRCW